MEKNHICLDNNKTYLSLSLFCGCSALCCTKGMCLVNGMFLNRKCIYAGIMVVMVYIFR